MFRKTARQSRLSMALVTAVAFAALALFAPSVILTSCKSSTIGNNPSSTKALDEDFAAIEYYLTHAYVAYDENVENRFDIKKSMKQMKKAYFKFYAEHKKSGFKVNGKDCPFENGIDCLALAQAFCQTLNQNLSVPDGHFAIYLPGQFSLAVFPSKTFKFSEILFEKIGGEYFVLSDFDSEIKKGMKYTGSEENLFVCPLEDGNIYRFGAISDGGENLELCLDDKKLAAEKYLVESPYHRNFSGRTGFIKTEKTFYVSLADMMLDSFDKDGYEKSYAALEAVVQELNEHREIKNLIFDLRGNGGGMFTFPQEILEAFFYGDDMSKKFAFTREVNNRAAKRLVSEVVLKTGIEYGQKSAATTAEERWGIDNKLKYMEDTKVQRQIISSFYGKQTLPQLLTLNEDRHIYFLTDKLTGSASELTIAYSYIENKDLITLIGTNTGGCIDFGGVYDYELPNSKLLLHLAYEEISPSAVLSDNPQWHGDTLGFYPDWWATPTELKPLLVKLTGDKDLENALRGLELGQR